MSDIDNKLVNICNDLKQAQKTPKNKTFGQDQAQKDSKIDFQQAKVGRKNRGYTKEHKTNYNDFRNDLRRTNNIESFKPEIIEKVQGEIIQDNDINQFSDLYLTTCISVLEDFKNNNPELVKKHPYMWYKNLLIEIKKNVPHISYKELDKCIAVWDILSYILNSIGLYITYEIFQTFTKIYDYQLKSMEEVNPKYIEFRQKIISDRDNALINEIAFNPYNQTNKIFLAKVHGIIEQTSPKTIEVNHNIRNYDNISHYRLSDSENDN